MGCSELKTGPWGRYDTICGFKPVYQSLSMGLGAKRVLVRNRNEYQIYRNRRLRRELRSDGEKID